MNLEFVTLQKGKEDYCNEKNSFNTSDIAFYVF